MLVTMDNGLPTQQNLAQFDLAVVVLRARSKRLDDLVPLIPEIERRLPNLRPGQAIRIHPPTSTESSDAERSGEHP